jgi:hypothetical protein
MTIDKSVPAFPQHGFDTIAERFTSQGGMTLRDYFAAKAMHALITRIAMSGVEVTERAYFIADAMLKAREGK